MSVQLKIIKKTSANFKKAPNLKNYNKTYKEFSWKKAEKEYLKFFKDGSLNTAYIAVDQHLETPQKDKVALIFHSVSGAHQKYTFATLARQSNKFANVLKNLKVKKGDRVFIFLPTIPERYVAFLGILKIGAIVGALFSAFQELALMDRLSDSQAKILITNSDLYPRIKAIWKDLPHLEKVIIVEQTAKKLPRGKNIVSFTNQMRKASEKFEIAHMKKDDFSYMLYTSGTTGKPKGVVHAHSDVLSAILTTKWVLDVQGDDIYWCTADCGWVTGVVYGILGIWGVGGTQVIFEGKFSAENWYKVIEENKVTVWYTAPTAIRMLMGSKVQPEDFDLSSLRHITSVGEPLNPEAIWWAYKKIGLPFHDTWWQTETGSMAIVNYPILDIKVGSMGKPFPGIKAAVIDEKGKELPAGREGNLALKPNTVYSLMKTIWKKKEKFDSYFSNGWYLSGDRAIKDNDGYFWFVGRADDVINTSSERVGPFEVESALVEHPEVVEAGVIGKPDPLRGEIIKAFIVLKMDAQPSDKLKENIAAFVKENLAGHAYPREIEFVDKLPKTRSGKIMRRLLRAKEMGLELGDTSTLEDY